METKLVRIAEISATSKHPIFTSVYHLINEDMLKQCHKELDGNKAVGIDKRRSFRKWFMIGSSSSRFTHILSLNGRSILSQLAESNVER